MLTIETYKSDIKEGLQIIKDSTDVAIGNLEDNLKPYYEIKEKFEEIQDIENEYEVETNIDYDDILQDIVRDIASDVYSAILNEFESILSDIYLWMDDVEDDEITTQQLQEYSNVINELKESLDEFEIRDDDDLENQLTNIINEIDNIEI